MEASNDPKAPHVSIDRPHNAAHPHHHIINEGINALPGNDGVDQLEMEKEELGYQAKHSHSADRSFHKGGIEVGETTPEYSSDEHPATYIDDREVPPTKFKVFYRRYRVFFHIGIGAFFTAWWLVGIILHRDLGWLKPFLLWLAIMLRLITFHVPIARWLYQIMGVTWKHTVARGVSFIPQKFRLPLGVLGTVAVFLVGSFVTAETEDNTRANRAVSLFGLLVIIFVMWLSSKHRKAVKWQTVVVGMLCQFIIALFVLRTQAGYDIFSFIGEMAGDLLGFAGQGIAFLLSTSVADLPGAFIVSVVPAIIFFVALTQVLYYYNILQWFIGKFAVFFSWAMQASGAESVVAAASPFIGQGESAMLVRPFVAHMTQAEIHQVMTSGFATIAGSVLAAYISFGVNPQAVISSCVMSIPASIAISKLRYPETEETLTNSNFKIPEDKEDRPANALHAFANGAWLGLKIGGMICATLLCILALLGLVNGLLGWGGHYFGFTVDLTIQLILGYICYPIAFLLGVPRADLLKVGELIGTKVVLNEFVAFTSLTSDVRYTSMSPRSILIASYALCGFGNIGSLGTQIGVLSQIAPGRSGDVSKLAFSALICGVLSTLTSAAVAGLLVTDQFVVTAAKTAA